MGEESFSVVSLDRGVEQAIVALKKGVHLLKYGRSGKPKLCPFRLSMDEKLLIWYSGKEEKQLKLNSVTQIIPGQKTINFQRQPQPEKECQSFSLIYGNGEYSLDLICKDKAQADSWLAGLRALISRSYNARPLGCNRRGIQTCHRGIQTCASSPVGYTRRKNNFGLLEEPTKISQVRSLCGSPPRSLAERCFSDGSSYYSESFYSSDSRSLSDMQNITDVVIPDSLYLKPDELKRENYARIYQRKMPSRGPVAAQGSPSKDEGDVLRDVLMWGEGIGSGNLGRGGFDTPKDKKCDALFPKLLESTMMLDVNNISLGGKHAALVTRQGEVFCWGEGKGGRLGHKTNVELSYPKVVESLHGIHVKSVACGEYQTCALTFSGELYAWGDSGNDVGRNDERQRRQWLPHRLSGPLDGINVSGVACGEWHMAIVSSLGQLFTYGDGTFGVLGHGDVQSVFQPKEVESLKGLRVKSVACGPWHTAAIVDVMVDHFEANALGGKLFTWGDGDKGKLGHFNEERRLLPTCVAKLVDHDFVQVSCGRMLTVGLTNKGTVYTMGSAKHGQLGNPRAEDISIAVVEGKLKEEFVKEISSGSYHIAVLTSRGNVYTWGEGANGRLGLGDTEDRSSPTLVEGLRGRKVERVACGSSFTAVICVHRSIDSIDQSACSGCKMVFGFTRKKHNCSNCGLLFCRSCTSKKAMNASLAPNKRKLFRVCDPCYSQLRKLAEANIPIMEANPSPRLRLTARDAYSELKTGKGETKLSRDLFSPKLSGNGECKQNQKKKPVDPLLPLSNGIPRWGQVPCPLLFSTYGIENCTAFLPHENQQFSVPPMHAQQIPCKSKSISSMAVSLEQGFSDTEKVLTEEVQQLSAEVKKLAKQCQIKSEKLQDYQQRISEAWSLAREEAEKCKAAKEVIKALTARLHTMSGKFLSDREANVVSILADGIDTQLPQITPISTNKPNFEAVDPIFTAPLTPEFGVSIYRKVDSLCNSPVLTPETVKSMYGRDLSLGNKGSLHDAQTERTGSRQYSSKTKNEWVEQEERGVYITFVTLPSGQNGLKRVRFSRKLYSEKEAEQWWEEHQLRVCEKYSIEGYVDPSTNVKG